MLTGRRNCGFFWQSYGILFFWPSDTESAGEACSGRCGRVFAAVFLIGQCTAAARQVLLLKAAAVFVRCLRLPRISVGET